MRVIIFFTIINYILETDRYFNQKTGWLMYFFGFELIATIICFFEYVMKCWSAQERKSYKHHGPAWACIAWMTTFESVVDLLSWLPSAIQYAMLFHAQQYQPLLILRLTRIFKSNSLLSAFRMVGRVVYFNRRILFQSFLMCALMVLASAVALYYARPAHDDQDNFNSILSCGYLAILMLTGQGEPFGVMPWYTRIVISIVALFAIAQFAIPASMLTWGFEQEAEHNIDVQHKREKQRAKRLSEGHANVYSSSSSGESDREEEWTAYVHQVAGESDGEESEPPEGKQDIKRNLPSSLSLVDRSKIIELSRSAASKLNEAELQRAKAIFVKLDEDQVGFLDWEKFRAVTGTDDQARELMGQVAAFHDVAGHDKVTMAEFLIWLGHVKKNYPRHGDKVLLRLLSSMEQKLSDKGQVSKWKRLRTVTRVAISLKTISAEKLHADASAKDVKAETAPPTEPEQGTSTGEQFMQMADFLGRRLAGEPAEGKVEAVAPGPSSPGQLLQIAEHMGELEKVNEGLRRKLKQLEKELRRAKAAS